MNVKHKKICAWYCYLMKRVKMTAIFCRGFYMEIYPWNDRMMPPSGPVMKVKLGIHRIVTEEKEYKKDLWMVE